MKTEDIKIFSCTSTNTTLGSASQCTLNIAGGKVHLSPPQQNTYLYNYTILTGCSRVYVTFRSASCCRLALVGKHYYRTTVSRALAKKTPDELEEDTMEDSNQSRLERNTNGSI